MLFRSDRGQYNRDSSLIYQDKRQVTGRAKKSKSDSGKSPNVVQCVKQGLTSIISAQKVVDDHEDFVRKLPIKQNTIATVMELFNNYNPTKSRNDCFGKYKKKKLVGCHFFSFYLLRYFY